MNAQPEVHKVAKKSYQEAIRAAKGDQAAIDRAQTEYRKALCEK